MELFGVIPKTGIEKGHGILVDMNRKIDDSYDMIVNKWICLYVHSWVRRESLVAYDTMRPLFVICAPNSTNLTHISNMCNNTYQGRNVDFTLKLYIDRNKEKDRI